MKRCRECEEKFGVDDTVVEINGDFVHDDDCAKEYLYNEYVSSGNTYDYETLKEMFEE